MLEYYNDRGGWWHELLHELVHGQVSGAGVFFKSVVFDSWKDWFETRTMKMHARRWTSGLKVSTATIDWEWDDLGPSDGVWVSLRESCWRNFRNFSLLL